MPHLFNSLPCILLFLRPFSALHCFLGDRNGIWSVKKLNVGLLVMMILLELCTTYSSSSSVVASTSIILCFNKHRLTQVTWKMDVKWQREKAVY